LNLKNLNLRRSLAAALGVLLLGLPTPAHASEVDIPIPMGQTKIITVPSGVIRVAIGDPSVANVSLIQDGTGRTLLIEAKKPGLTNFLVWQNSGPVQNYILEVLSSRRPETVAIRAKVLEIRLGRNDQTGVKWAESLGFKEAPPDSPFRLGLPVRNSLLEATINLLLQNNQAELKAEPTLVTMNGVEAKFLSGGEVPVVVQTPNTVAVEWKPYGVSLAATPVIEGSDDVVLNLKTEVSGLDLDPTHAVKQANLNIPAIVTRNTSTTVTLKSGQSVVLAGLLKSEKSTELNRVPILGQIPLLGALFTSTQEVENRTELVFVVTPTIVQNNEVKPESDYGQSK
jgi:Flp pilus assembly secretin CpaC